MWGSATLAIVVSSPCMMFANMIDSVTQPRLAIGPRIDAIPGLGEGAIRISPWSKNRHIMIGLTTPKAKVRRVHGCRACSHLHSAVAQRVMTCRSVVFGLGVRVGRAPGLTIGHPMPVPKRRTAVG